MASDQRTADYVADQLSPLEVRTARMFGEFAVYYDGKVVAFICDDQLFLKPTAEGKAFLGRVTEAPAYPGSKNYFLMSAELDDPERLNAALQVTARALPEKKAKSSKARPVAPRKPPSKKRKKSSPHRKKAAKSK